MFGMSFDCFALGLRLALAVLVGGMLGLNRDLHRKPAGSPHPCLGVPRERRGDDADL